MRELIAVLFASTMLAQGPFDGKAGPMVKAGYDLLVKGQFNEANAKFQEASKADPSSSFPISGLSKLYFEASNATDPSHQSEYRNRSKSLAHQALDLNDMDFIASEVLLNTDGASAGSSHHPTPEAEAAFNVADSLFQKEKWEDAAAGYQKALALDPAFTNAALYLGDVYFSQKQYTKAEPWFRQATTMEPRYCRAWRFLTDCYLSMGRLDDAMAADFSAVAAQPEDYTAWARLKQVYQAQRKIGLIRFQWPSVQASQIVKKPDGKSDIVVPQDILSKTPEGLAAVGYSLMIPMIQISDAKPDNKNKKRSELEREALAWKAAMEAYENELKVKRLRQRMLLGRRSYLSTKQTN